MQGHKVHVVGMPEAWGRELPGIAEDKGEKKREEVKERMKIAYRYERLGQFGEGRERGAFFCSCCVLPIYDVFDLESGF